MWQGINKRRFPRASYPCRVIVTKEKHAEKFDTHTENIGEGGICTVLDKRVNRFTEVDLILYLKDGLPPIAVKGKTVWVIERDRSEFDTGIEFLDLKEEHRLRISRIVDECLKADRS
jgi:hypothetical protein